MATPRVRTRYPQAFYQLLYRAKSEGEWRVALNDEQKARRLRNRLYAFRQALLDAPETAPDLAIIAPLFSFYIKEGNLTIYLRQPESFDA